MKKRSRLLALLVAAAMLLPILPSFPVHAEGDIPIDENHFPDYGFREAIRAYDRDGNGYLSTYERESVRNIHCEGCNIYSVEGIEYFPYIQGLWCLRNHISDWDLSHNTDLVGIWCSENDFTYLDFTGLDKLEWVYCFDCNLTSINFTNNPKLAYVECNSNPNLTSIDFSQNHDLENLFCSKCGLTSLDLSGNPLLCELDAFKNHLTSLELAGNTMLKRLDIWDNENLGDVDISFLTGLEFYNCANNGVTSLDMSNNPQLQILICGYNEDLRYLNVTANPRLADLRLECDYQLPALDLSNNHQLYNLYAFGLRDLPSVDISNNPYLIRTLETGVYMDEPQLGYVHSYTIEYGGSEEYFEDLTHCLVVDDGKPVITDGGNPAVVPECYYDTNDGHSDSEQFATRGQAIELLWEKAGCPGAGSGTRFTDISGSPYESAIRWGEANNICFGYPSICSDSFCPDELINREDFALMAHRLAGYMKLGTSFDYGRTDWFNDFFSIEYYGWGAFTWAIQFEVLGNDGTNCYPHGRITIEELAAGADKIFNLDEAASYSSIVHGNGIPSGDGVSNRMPANGGDSNGSGSSVPDCVWIHTDGKSYWYERGVRQGTSGDPKGVVGDGTVRGREIYDPASDGWYWLDSVYGGAKAVGKEVWMPYVYQGEGGWDNSVIWNEAKNSDEGMEIYVYYCIINKTGKWVRYDENGKMLKGWVHITGTLAQLYPDQAGNTYYYDTKTGIMAKGDLLIDGVLCHFDEETGALMQ